MRVKEFIVERKKKSKKKKAKNAKLGRYYYPGFGYYGLGHSSDSNSTDTGGGDGGSVENIGEDAISNPKVIESEVEKFKKWACQRLSIENPPKIELSYDTEEAQNGHHTGKHVEGSDSVWVYVNNRNLVDILRTVFHELVHWRQSELGMIEHGDSYPGSAIEAMADMLSGKYIKIYGKNNRNIFQ